MPQIISNRRTSAATAALLLLLACLMLAACGGSSSGSSTAASASATTSTTGGAAGGRFAALRECMQKNGITLPKRTPGKRRAPGTGGFLGSGPLIPKGVTQAQYDAALKKCGGGLRGSGARANPAALKQTLTKFAACMHENGVSLPAPNTSGKGPIFNTKGLNTTSAQFKTAEAKCSAALRAAFGVQPGAGRPTATTGAPPSAKG